MTKRGQSRENMGRLFGTRRVLRKGQPPILAIPFTGSFQRARDRGKSPRQGRVAALRLDNDIMDQTGSARFLHGCAKMIEASDSPGLKFRTSSASCSVLC